MQAIILAAGQGTRMGPLTETTPKPMLPVADRPLVAHAADAAIKAGADELILIVGYRGEQVRNYFGTNYAGVPVQYAEQRKQRGTADAVAAAAHLLDDDFAVLNGDSLYCSEDLRRLFDSVPQVGAIRVENPSDYGVLATEGSVVVAVQEKPDDPPTNLINAGAYTFPNSVIDLLDVPESDRGEYELTDVLDRIIERRELEYVAFETWMDVGRPWELLAANEKLLSGGAIESTVTDGGDIQIVKGESESGTNTGGHNSEIHPNATVRGDVVIEDDVSVGPGVVIDGPALIRSGSSIGPNAYLRGATLIEENVHIGHAVEIKNSVVMADSAVGHLSYVGDSVLASGVNLGAGTNVANLRHDNDPVVVTVKNERVSTGRRKFGTVLGPDVKTGIQTGINAGVTLSEGTQTEPGEIVLRDR